ncbi:hypothetical protein ACE193_17715 [Bernardetia sp. OM2101]|uniref:hypothetical protein n=1 Tax=Bernardetia sp. OM2101 TaxID=3344876 RepID=UPI0035D0659E
MKNLILILSLCFVLFSCFEKEEEITVVPEEEPTGDFDVMKCDEVTDFIEYVANNEPREPRPTLKKYNKNGNFFYRLDKGGKPFVDEYVEILYYNINCEVVCSSNHGTMGGICPDDFNDGLVFIETVWQDER